MECDAGRRKACAWDPQVELLGLRPERDQSSGVRVYGQGFEFDYVGVIFGRDLVYDAGWRGNRKISHDSVVKKAPEEEFVNLVKQTYRVLLTGGMKGCYVYFEDSKTRDFLLSRIKRETSIPAANV